MFKMQPFQREKAFKSL